MTVSLLFFVASSLLLFCSRSHEIYDNLDIASAKDVWGYIPDQHMMHLVHELTPRARKDIRTLRDRITKEEKKLEEAESQLDLDEDRLSVRQLQYERTQEAIEAFKACLTDKHAQCSDVSYFQQHESDCKASGCGDLEALEKDLATTRNEVKSAQKTVKKARINSTKITDYIKKLQEGLDRLLQDEGPKPSDEPRETGTTVEKEPENYKKSSNAKAKW